ncbi:hypothetical protein ACNJX9_12520 [Bradyrhizobium sp. DASA03076]|jgi:hypothetical protein|uniref:baeRF11 domain-containing protein n=1 Tax=Bradyrhizobium sp. BLXBL-03 TaxID=3395916 RepID=UPI003F6F0ECA
MDGSLAAFEDPMLHIDIPTIAEFRDLAQLRAEFCISMYMPMSRLGANAEANRTLFKDLAKEALVQLRQAGVNTRVIEAFESRFEQLAGGEHDPDQDKVRQRQRAKPDESLSFWHYQGNGLAVLAVPEMLHTFRMAETPRQLVEVADRLQLAPLLRAMTSRHDAFVLALAEESVRLVQVFANSPPLRVWVPGLPKNAEEASHRPSFHVRAPRGRLQNLEGEKVLLHQYVEKVDHAVQNVLRGHTTPLILVAVEPLASMFRAVCDYPEFVEQAMQGNPDRLTDAELEDRAIPILDQLYAREVTNLIARYEELKPRRATTDLSYAAHAATAGAVDQLLVDLDAVVPGLVSDVDGSVTYAASDDAEVYNVVDEVARRALCTGARVLAASREQLPERAPLAAILRYQFI